MDENTNQNETQADRQEANKPEQQPASPSEPTSTTPSSGGVVYASFLERFLAGFIDALLIGVASGILGALFGFGRGNEPGSGMFNPFQILGWIYWVYMDVKYGASLGKMALNLRVQREDTGENLDWVGAILREVVGKFLSTVVFFVGYLWMIWDPKKQTWHDKIAKSIVVKTK